MQLDSWNAPISDVLATHECTRTDLTFFRSGEGNHSTLFLHILTFLPIRRGAKTTYQRAYRCCHKRTNLLSALVLVVFALCILQLARDPLHLVFVLVHLRHTKRCTVHCANNRSGPSSPYCSTGRLFMGRLEQGHQTPLIWRPLVWLV